jgi:chemotaxis protein histidine kinase CheA
MRQTKKGRKPNFRTTKRKRGGMPTGAPKGKELERVLPLVERMQDKLKKKRQGESPYKTLEYTMAAHEKYLADQAQRELDKKNAEIERERLASEAEIAAKEEKALKAAKARALADEKALKAAKAKAEADAKAAAESEKAKAAAEKAKEKAKAEAEKEERKRLRVAEDAKAAEEERAKVAAEKERLRLEKKAQRQALKTAEERARAEEQAIAEAQAHARAEVEARAIARSQMLHIQPINGMLFWQPFFTPQELEYLQTLTVTREDIDSDRFYIPPDTIDTIGPITVTPEQATSINRTLCKLILIFGILEQKFNERHFECELIWKGTRAITLATGVLLDTHDIDIEIVNSDKTDESGREKRMFLARHIGGLIGYLLYGAPLSILDPYDPKAINKDIVKISYMAGTRIYIPILDLGFDKKYVINIDEIPYVISDRNEEYIETTTKPGLLYKHPSIDSMKKEKEVYLKKYTQEGNPVDIKKMKAGLLKIEYASGNITKEEFEKAQTVPKSIPIIAEDKGKLQALIDARLAESKAKTQSQKPSSDSTSGKS